FFCPPGLRLCQESQSPYATGYIHSFYAFDTKRLQCNRVLVTSDEGIGADTESSRNSSSGANIVSRERAGARVIGRRYDSPNHHAARLIADIDAKRFDRACVVFLRTAVTRFVYAFDVARSA